MTGGKYDDGAGEATSQISEVNTEEGESTARSPTANVGSKYNFINSVAVGTENKMESIGIMLDGIKQQNGQEEVNHATYDNVQNYHYLCLKLFVTIIKSLSGRLKC